MDAAGTFVRGGVYGTDANFVTSGGAATLASATHQQITGAITAQDNASFTTLNISGNHNLTLAAAQTVTLNGILKSGNTAGGAIISGGTGINTVSNGELVVRTDGVNDAVTISTPILANGTSSLTKSGAGTLTLSTANTITGGVRLNAGQLNINHAGALGTVASRLTINDGTTLDNTSGGNVSILTKNPITINGSFTYLGTSGDLSIPDDNGQNITMLNDATITVVANTLKLTGGFAGGGSATSASLTKNGAGTLWIGTNGNSNYSGGLIVNAGVVTGNQGQPDRFAGTGPITLGATSGSTNAILSSGNAIAHSAPITVRAGSTGILALTSYNGTGTWAGAVTLNNNLTVGGAGGVTLTSVISGSGGLNIGNAGTYSVSSGNIKSLANTATVTLLGDNTFTGDTVMVTTSNGSLQLSNLNALKNSTLDTGTSGSQQVTFGVSGNNTYNLGGLKGADALAFGANTISVGANDQSTAYTGALSGSGGAFTKTGSGKLTLSGTNNYTGVSTLSAGTLQFTKIASLYNSAPASWTAANIRVASGATLALNVGGTGEFSTGNVTTVLTNLGSLGGAPGSGLGLQAGSKIAFDTNNASSSSFTVANNIADSTGTGGGAIGVTKLGTNTLELSGTNTYAGASIVSEGTLLLNGANTGGGLVSVAAAAILGGTGTTTAPVNVTGVLSPGASIQSLASGALTMNNGSTFVYEAADNTASGADLMVVNGALSLTSVNLDLSAANLGLGTWASGDKLTLISYTGTAITSGFTGFTDDTTYTYGANQWIFDYNDTAKGLNYGGDAATPGSGSFVTFTVVPEPSVAMLVGGLGMIALLRRRRA